MQFFHHPITTVVAIAAMVVPQVAAAAPRSWLLPSATNFNGGDAWVTVDAALSTDLYYPDHPGQPWTPIATAPDGTSLQVENLSKGKLRLTFDLHLTAQGTYKLAVVNNGVMGSYMQGGERKPLPRGTTTETLAQAIPADATEVWTAENNSRVETFVTNGVPNDTVFKPTGKGLEMVPVSHPTDLSVQDAATFQFLLDGKPAADIAVSAINGGVRYAPMQQLELKTDAQGKVTIKWPAPGMWWVSASIGGGREGGPGGPGGEGRPGGPGGSGAPGAGGPGGGGEGGFRRPMGPPQRRASYAMTVEVLG